MVWQSSRQKTQVYNWNISSNHGTSGLRKRSNFPSSLLEVVIGTSLTNSTFIFGCRLIWTIKYSTLSSAKCPTMLVAFASSWKQTLMVLNLNASPPIHWLKSTAYPTSTNFATIHTLATYKLGHRHLEENALPLVQIIYMAPLANLR